VATANLLRAARVADLKDVVRLIEEDLARVEALFAEQLQSQIALVGEMGRYVRDGGGKRIRPALLLLAARLCGHRSEREVLLGAVVEFIHTATLLHDDIIDEAPLRRGRSTVNSRWGNDATVLLGDLLYAKSMSMALTQENLPVLRLLSDVTVKMTEGELVEIERRNDTRVSEEDHIELVRRKTACLFSACTQIGGLLAGVDPPHERALASFGMNLGICFQLVDDLLDFEGDERTLGKPVVNDLREGKLTLPAIYMLRRPEGRGAACVRLILEDSGFERVTPQELVRLAREEGALDDARRKAESYAQAARRDLAGFEPSPYRDALLAAPEFVLGRAR
jgi:octaprenyl-diphosphate synthase